MFFSGISDIGKRRATNQDSFSIIPLSGGHTLCTVCDGMGGASGGNVASEIALSTYTEYVENNFTSETEKWQQLLFDAVSAANTAVYERAAGDEALKGMGTTLASLLVSENGDACAVNVGDSRIYCLDGGALRQITRDHSYVQYLVDMGQLTLKEAETASIRNIIIRSVGNEAAANPDFFDLKLGSGSVILLCSDGLTNCVGSDGIVGAISAENEDELKASAEKLIELANDGGGTDNITVILGKI